MKDQYLKAVNDNMMFVIIKYHISVAIGSLVNFAMPGDGNDQIFSLYTQYKIFII